MSAPDRAAARAMNWSLAVGLLMLLGKSAAYWMTGSAAILSDAAESVIHLGAVTFAAISVRMVARPPRAASPYGYDRIAFLSAGFEGGMIIVAALWIIAAVVEKWLHGLVLEQLGAGTLIVLAASLANLALGWYLVNAGRRTRSLILEANGAHVLTDSWTSFGVVAGLGLVLLTGWKPFDPLCAMAVAINILWSGFGLTRRAFRGLMDLPDPAKAAPIQRAATELCANLGIVGFHRLRHRDTGRVEIVSLHLLLASEISLREAHSLATQFEEALAAALPFPVEVITHLEPAGDHDSVHPHEHTHWS